LAKNDLESYAYYLRDNTATLEDAINKTILWLDNSQVASREEYEWMQQELESIVSYVHLARIVRNRHRIPFLSSLTKKP